MKDNTYYIDTITGTMKDSAGNSHTEEFFGNVHRQHQQYWQLH